MGMVAKYERKHIACDGLNFEWTDTQIEEFIYLWQEGTTLIDLSKYFRRKQEEILLLALDQAMLEEIEPRQGGLIGGYPEEVDEDTGPDNGDQ